MRTGSFDLKFLAAVALSVLSVLFLSVGGRTSGQSRFGQPRTVLHVVSIQWKPGVTDEQKAKVLEGVRSMAGTIPGIKNVWIKSERMEPRGFEDGFAIEFKDQAAAIAYASNPIHQSWNENYATLHIASVSMEIGNP